MRSLAPRLCAAAMLGAMVAHASGALAWERQWRLGGELGYAMTDIGDGTLDGMAGGLHLTYGLSDAFNVRLGGDLAGFDRPEPATYALLWSTTVGIEYVVDILEWVPYVGACAGAMGVFREGEEPAATGRPEHAIYGGVEIPAGLGYQVLPELTVGAEFRYRLLLLGTDVGPIGFLTVLGRAEVVFGE